MIHLLSDLPTATIRRMSTRLRRTVLATLILWAAASPARALAPSQTPAPSPTAMATAEAQADPFEGAAAAPTPTPKPEGNSFSLYVDQDSAYPWLGPWGGDQNYTMGVGFGFTGRWIHSVGLDRPLRALDDVSGLAKLHGRLKTNAGLDFSEGHSLLVAVGAFTPRRLEVSAPIFDDRPYSSILSLTTGRTTIDPVGRRAFKTELTLGILGLRIAESVQTSIHAKRRANNQKKEPGKLTPYDPQGWGHQVADGGSLTAKYTASLLKAVAETKYHDVGLSGEASLGYYTNVAFGPVLRFGLLRSDIWAASTNPLTAVNQAMDPKCGAGERDRNPKKLELYGFVAGRLRLVGYNALLQGWGRASKSDVTIGSTHIEPLVREFEGGVTAAYRKAVLTIALAHRSAEYNVGTPRGHTWGGAYVTWRWKQPEQPAPIPPESCGKAPKTKAG